MLGWITSGQGAVLSSLDMLKQKQDPSYSAATIVITHKRKSCRCQCQLDVCRHHSNPLVLILLTMHNVRPCAWPGNVLFNAD